MHLKVEELVDLAEGTRAESCAPHLAGCAVCRRQLDDLRKTLATAANVDVPEPSPLFWNHLSRRVSEAVAAEEISRPTWWSWLTDSRLVPMVAAAVAAILVIVVLNVRDRRVAQISPAVASSAIAHETMPDPQLGDTDPSLALVAELTSEMDLDGAAEAGFAPLGSAEHAVTHMDRDELRELQRILKQELANSGG